MKYRMKRIERKGKRNRYVQDNRQSVLCYSGDINTSTDETAAREYMALAVLSLLTGVFCLLLEDIHLRFSRGGGNLRKNNSTAICPHCGKFINRHDNCCKHCGLKINTGA